jgi:hypothetical protein
MPYLMKGIYFRIIFCIQPWYWHGNKNEKHCFLFLFHFSLLFQVVHPAAYSGSDVPAPSFNNKLKTPGYERCAQRI